MAEIVGFVDLGRKAEGVFLKKGDIVLRGVAMDAPKGPELHPIPRISERNGLYAFHADPVGYWNVPYPAFHPYKGGLVILVEPKDMEPPSPDAVLAALRVTRVMKSSVTAETIWVSGETLYLNYWKKCHRLVTCDGVRTSDLPRLKCLDQIDDEAETPSCEPTGTGRSPGSCIDELRDILTSSESEVPMEDRRAILLKVADVLPKRFILWHSWLREWLAGRVSTGDTRLAVGALIDASVSSPRMDRLAGEGILPWHIDLGVISIWFADQGWSSQAGLIRLMLEDCTRPLVADSVHRIIEKAQALLVRSPKPVAHDTLPSEGTIKEMLARSLPPDVEPLSEGEVAVILVVASRFIPASLVMWHSWYEDFIHHRASRQGTYRCMTSLLSRSERDLRQCEERGIEEEHLNMAFATMLLTIVPSPRIAASVVDVFDDATREKGVHQLRLLVECISRVGRNHGQVRSVSDDALARVDSSITKVREEVPVGMFPEWDAWYDDWKRGFCNSDECADLSQKLCKNTDVGKTIEPALRYRLFLVLCALTVAGTPYPDLRERFVGVIGLLLDKDTRDEAVRIHGRLMREVHETYESITRYEGGLRQ